MPKSKGRSHIGRGARPPADVPANQTTAQPGAYGLEIDGMVSPLQGQPPVAVSKGWGTLPRGA